METLNYVNLATEHYDKKLGCRTETARCFVSLTISLSHSRSLKLIRNDIIE